MSDVVIREGFLCPICMQDLGTVSQLQIHFDVAHANEDKAVLNQLKGLFDKAKKKLLKKDDEDEIPGTSFATDTALATGLSAVSIGESITWDPQELGHTRSHTDYLKHIREARIDRFVVETNKLLIRLDKLLGPEAPEEPSRRKAFEKTIVPWVLDADVNHCTSCGKSFGITRRRHHCRLCGGIMCNSCSQFLPYSYAQKLTNPSFHYEGEGFRRSSSTTSLNSILGSEGDVHIRTCAHCRMLLERRDTQMEQRNAKPFVVQLYERMRVYMDEADELIPKFYEMADALNAGETNYSLQDAQDHRFKIMKLYESIDSISKRILSHGMEQGAENSLPPKQAQLQRMIRVNASNYLQQNLMGLQSLPSEDQLVILQEKRKREIQKRIEEEKRAAAERQRKRQEEQERKKKMELRSQATPVGARERPEGAENVPSGSQGWKPLEAGGQDKSMDPMIQQMNNIKAYIKQAKQAGKWDEVHMLDDNLKMLQQEYWKQTHDALGKS